MLYTFMIIWVASWFTSIGNSIKVLASDAGTKCYESYTPERGEDVSDDDWKARLSEIEAESGTLNNLRGVLLFYVIAGFFIPLYYAFIRIFMCKLRICGCCDDRAEVFAHYLGDR